MNDDILNIKVAKKDQGRRLLKIKSIDKKWVTLKSGDMAEKVVLHVIDEALGNHPFKISDCWVKDRKGRRITGLWFTLTDGEINQSSSLAQTLRFYEAEMLGDLIGKEIQAVPDEKDYLVLVACEM